MKFKFGLLPRVVLAIVLGVACGFFLPGWATRIALTFNAIFGQFLGFAIPLLILGLVAPGIADLGRNAGRLLALTAALAYAFTLFSGFGTYLTPSDRRCSKAPCRTPRAALAPSFTVAARRCDVGAGPRLRAGAGHGLYPFGDAQGGDGRFQADHRAGDSARHHSAAALLHFRHLSVDDPVGASGRGCWTSS